MAIKAQGLIKDYGSGENLVHTLRGVDVEFERGRFTVIMGPSASGKSTLMHTLTGLDTATSGHVYLNGAEAAGVKGKRTSRRGGRRGVVDLTKLNDNQLTLLRRQSLGFIFQSFNLLPMFTARQNILIPLILDGAKPDTTWLGVLAKTLGLEERLTHRPSELSGG